MKNMMREQIEDNLDRIVRLVIGLREKADIASCKVGMRTKESAFNLGKFQAYSLVAEELVQTFGIAV